MRYSSSNIPRLILQSKNLGFISSFLVFEVEVITSIVERGKDRNKGPPAAEHVQGINLMASKAFVTSSSSPPPSVGGEGKNSAVN